MQWLIDQLKLFDIKPSPSYIGWVLFLVSFHSEDFRNERQRSPRVADSKVHARSYSLSVLRLFVTADYRFVDLTFLTMIKSQAGF